jgi:flagellar FliL protein
MKRKAIILATVLVAAGAGIAAYVAFGGSADAESKGKDAHGKTEAQFDPTYLPLDPPFVVNVSDGEDSRFLQVTMEAMTTRPEAAEAVKKHMPAIRGRLVLLLSEQPYASLTTTEGKEKLLSAALGEIRKVIARSGNGATVDALYFTGFVMQ